MIIQPLWNVLNEFLENEVEVCINNSVTNLNCWERILEDIDKKNKNNEKKISAFEPIKEEILKTEEEDPNRDKSDQNNNEEEADNSQIITESDDDNKDSDDSGQEVVIKREINEK